MSDLRPVGYIVGLLIAALGVLMLFPLALDMAAGSDNWRTFLESAIVTSVIGMTTALACNDRGGRGLSLQDSYVLTVAIWVLLPLFGAIPFVLGAPGASMTDAYFEAVSGITTTGTTVFVGLDDLSPGVNLWRGMLQWLGGLGIVIIALVFLPVMRVGGMQFFRSEAFDTMGKVLPRVVDISVALIQIYVGVTLACAAFYWALGMSGFEAVVHAMTTIATGGFSTSDASFVQFSGRLEYVAVVFTLLATLPFIRFIQLMRGSVSPLWQDVQVRTYLSVAAVAIGVVMLWRVLSQGAAVEPAIRESAFAVVTIISGTGYSSADVLLWGSLPFVVLLIVGFIGGCTASTGCSVKVFRYLVMFEAVRNQLRRLQSPSAVLPMRLQGRTLEPDVVTSVMVFFVLFVLSFGVLAVALSMTGLSPRSAITAAWTSIANIGPVFGAEVGPTGAVDGFPVMAKWLMITGMVVGRLELLSVYVLFTRRFWLR